MRSKGNDGRAPTAWILRTAQDDGSLSLFLGSDLAWLHFNLKCSSRNGWIATARFSQATQKQALNALVFFVQEGLHRDLGEFNFERAKRGAKIPTVLSPEQCGQLFAGLAGTPRLMAEVMYGSGLRLMELLRLRIHHLDLARGQIQVFAGKGDRVNGFADAIQQVTV